MPLPRVRLRVYALVLAIALLSSILFVATPSRAEANETRVALLLPEAPDVFGDMPRSSGCDDYAGCLNETPVNDENTTIVVALTGSVHVDVRLQNLSASLSIGTIYSVSQWVWARKNSSGDPQFTISFLSASGGCGGYSPSLTQAFANYSTTISDPAPCGSNSTWTRDDVDNLVYRLSVAGGPTSDTTITSAGILVTYATPCVASTNDPLPSCMMDPLIQIIVAVMILGIIFSVFSLIVGVLFGLSKKFEVKR